MTLDVPTLFIVVTVVALLMAFWVCVMAWGQPRGEALWAWAAGMLAYSLSNVLFGLRPTMSIGLGVLSSNAFHSLAMSLMLLAVRRFQGHRERNWTVFLPILLVPSLLLHLDDYAMRVVIAAAILCLQIGLVLSALVDRRYPIPGRGRYIMFVAFSALAASLLVRAVAIGAGWLEVRSLEEANYWQALIFLVAMCAVISLALGFVYMTMERAERRSFELAMKDMLTGLSNRRAISEELQVAVARAQRSGQLLGVLMLDIDHFKKVNDGYGHQAGDVVLRSVAQTLQSRLRAQDQIGRFGGEEFLVVLPDAGLDGATTLAEALRAAVEATPAQWGAQRIGVTISIGVRAGMVTGADTPDSLVAAADAALYRAKQGGRNRVEH